MTRPTTLVAASTTMILAMFVLAPWLTRTFPAPFGYLSIYLLYWVGFCLPLGFWFQRSGAALANLSLHVGQARWVPWAVGAQVALIAFANWVLLPGSVPLSVLGLAILFAVINGFLEEFFWRGAYLEQGGRHSWKFMGVGSVLFGVWHIALGTAEGVTYEGGVMALAAGGFFLGLFWTFIAYQTGRTGWTMIAHVLTNVAAFTTLIATNFVG